MAQGVEPEFKPQYHKNNNNKKTCDHIFGLNCILSNDKSTSWNRFHGLIRSFLMCLVFFHNIYPLTISWSDFLVSKIIEFLNILSVYKKFPGYAALWSELHPAWNWHFNIYRCICREQIVATLWLCFLQLFKAKFLTIAPRGCF
jgi:hypothetical protein